jgi:hypothetical protein
MSGSPQPLADGELPAITERARQATPGPWFSWIERRDFLGGSSIIGTAGDDLYISEATAFDQDFIASARQDIPKLIEMLARLTTATSPGESPFDLTAGQLAQLDRNRLACSLRLHDPLGQGPRGSLATDGTPADVAFAEHAWGDMTRLLDEIGRLRSLQKVPGAAPTR